MRERYFFRAEAGEGGVRWWLLLPIWIALAWYFAPALQGDFVADDYVFLTTARMVDAPLNAFWQSHFYEPYYFRPLGVLSWWGATRLFALDYGSHALINLMLHAANVGLLCWLLRALAVRGVTVVATAALFAFGPFALATMLWPSNRFDLLACGFLLALAIAVVRALRGSAGAVMLAMVLALAACWSKELAYPVATLLAVLVLFAKSLAWRRRVILFVALGVGITAAFAVRHLKVSAAYAIASADPVAQVIEGAKALYVSAPKLVGLVLGVDSVPGLGLVCAIALLLALLWTRRDAEQSNGLLAASALLFVAVVVVQTPLAKPFAAMLDGGPFGTVTYARFYYAPWLALCVVVALILSRARLGAFSALTLLGAAVIAGIYSRPLPEAFADWTRSEVRPLSVLATRAVEAAAPTVAGEPCVFVLLGAEAKHPYFRMFSDVTVKARTTMPDRVWRCHVMTEKTPWLFAFPDGMTITDLPLRPILNPDGAPKPDSAWGGIRYRYRFPAKDLAALSGAHFLDWRGGEFVDVTADVRAGRVKVAAADW